LSVKRLMNARSVSAWIGSAPASQPDHYFRRQNPMTGSFRFSPGRRPAAGVLALLLMLGMSAGVAAQEQPPAADDTEVAAEAPVEAEAPPPVPEPEPEPEPVEVDEATSSSSAPTAR
jgi:hypothetical protein